MKKLFLILAVLMSVCAVAQDIPPGYTNLNSRNQWLAGLFKAFGYPSGDSARFQTGQAQRAGAVFFDSTDNNTPAGVYVWDGVQWVLQGQPTSVSQPDEVIIGRSVTWEGGFKFHVQEGIVRINNILYGLDSITLTLDSNDATYDRFDRIYDDVDGAHVLEGVATDPAAIPQLQAGQIGLTTILLENGGTNPSVSSLIVYQENDATITPTGTTAVGNATAAPFQGTYHIRITTINHGDYVEIIKPSGTWDISQVTSFVIHVKNRAQVPQLANLRVSLWNGSSTGSQVSPEVVLNYNKNNTSSYMAIAIPMSIFGAITNTNIDRIRLRFMSNNSNNFTGYDIDNIEFQAGVPQPGNGSTGQFTLNVPSFLTLTPSNTIVTNNTTYTLAANGNSSQIVRGDGSLATFSAVTTVGAFGSQASNSNGAVISGSTIYFQPVTSSNPGMTTSAMKASWDSVYTAENLSSLGDSIMTQVAVDRLGFKSLVAGTNVTLTDTDSTIVIAASGGGSGGRFGFTGEDDEAAEERTFETDGNNFTIGSSVSGSTTALKHTFAAGDELKVEVGDGDQNVYMKAEFEGQTALVAVNKVSAGVRFESTVGEYVIVNIPDSAIAGTHHMVVYNESDDRLYKMDLPTGGGGGSGANTALSNLASVAINTSLVSDADNTDDLGSSANSWKDIYSRTLKLDGSTSGTVTLASDALSNSLNTTTLSGTGYGAGTMISRITSDFTMANSNTEQPIFPTTGDVWTLQGSTTYEFEMKVYLTHLAVSHSVGLSFPLGGGASVTSINWTSICWTVAVNSSVTTQHTAWSTQTANTAVNAAGANAIEYIVVTGIISMNAGGTVTPSLTFSADPTGTILSKAGGYIKFTPIGTNTITTLGNVN